MPFDGFMWIPKGGSRNAPAVEGETQDPYYASKKAFSIKSFSLDVENQTSIGSAGSVQRHQLAGHPKDRLFQRLLHRGAMILPLPAHEGPAVELYG